MAQLTLSDYKNNLFSNHFLEERIQERENWQEIDFEEKFDNFKDLYDEKEGLLSTNLNEDQTQDNFIDPVLRKLGHDWVTEASKRVGSRTEGKNLNPDYAFMDSSQKLKVHQDNEDPLEINYAVGDAKSWDKKLDRSTQDHNNPAFQIYNYVDRLRADWGILTNGKKWRLYSYEKCAADIYFEVDLENILAGEKTAEKIEAFKYFYLFFRAQSFEDGFLKDIYQESVNFAEGLEDDLEDKVYNSLEVAVEGFFETNDIDKTEENIDLVHHASLIFLYRILFILNAESRELLPTDDEAYQQAFGLMELKRMIAEEEEDDPLFQDTTVAWDNRLSRLFEGIDEGYDLHETKIPAYNGGLFDEERSEENQFLAENKLYGSYLKEILELLATSKNENVDKRIIVDYKDLNIRHLGSVYEGLLEHKFKAADERKILKNEQWKNFSGTDKAWEELNEEKRVEENELYLTNESGERKATGSYYTPEYIVEYIVENTVGPKVEEKIKEAKENNENILPKVLELNVCDPAMGSGHFLTEATEYIAEHIVQHADLEDQKIDENEDELNWAKRQVVQNCIYGVDINELAVELGKLSLWIETMAEGKPLNFLDHHLKHGNSLIGSDFDEIFSHPTEDQKRLDSERYQFGNPQEIKENFQEQYLEIEEMPENTVEQIHEKEQAYKQFISNNTLYQQFQQLANIHTRQHFTKEANSSDYESFLINIGNPGNPFENTEWYKNTQQDAENRNYFHWQLEFPKVFFGQQEGFDAVVGNPPYISVTNIPEFLRDYIKDQYRLAKGRFDTYIVFWERSMNLAGQNGLVSEILPIKWAIYGNGRPMRDFMLDEVDLREICNISQCDVFPGVTTYPCIPIAEKKASEEGNVDVINLEKDPEILGNRDEIEEKGLLNEIPKKRFDNVPQRIICPYVTDENWKIYSKMSQEGEELGELYRLEQAIRMGSESARDELITSDPDEEDEYYPLVDGKNISRYSIDFEGRYLKYEPEKLYNAKSRELLDQNKILIKRIAERLTVAYDGGIDGKYVFPLNTVYTLTNPNYEDKTPKFHTGILNSKLQDWLYKLLFNAISVRGGYIEFREYLKHLPLLSSEIDSKIPELVDKIDDLKQQRKSVNLNIQDYLGNYSDGKTLGDLYSPVEGLSDKIVSDTSADRDSLRIGGVEFEDRNDKLILMVSARYKPEDSENIDEDELDRWGYFETEKVPAMRFSGISGDSGSRSEDGELRGDVDDKLRPLIEEFVSLAVDEAGGFAGFRESATKTNSVIDRLEKLTLPKLEDVEQGLEKFIDNREEAEELEEEIQETDELIDAIVFDLYDLTEEEVETVLDSLDTGEGEKASIFKNFNEV